MKSLSPLQLDILRAVADAKAHATDTQAPFAISTVELAVAHRREIRTVAYIVTDLANHGFFVIYENYGTLCEFESRDDQKIAAALATQKGAS